MKFHTTPVKNNEVLTPALWKKQMAALRKLKPQRDWGYPKPLVDAAKKLTPKP